MTARCARATAIRASLARALLTFLPRRCNSASDAWRFAPLWKLTTGGRLENWSAFDGFNLNTMTLNPGTITGTSATNQPQLNATRFSPKGALSLEPNKQLEYTASVGIANRFPTVTELYQSTTTAGQVVFPNPNLKPEESLVTELAAIRKFTDGKIRLSLFQENTRDMIISQQTTLPNSATRSSTWMWRNLPRASTRCRRTVALSAMQMPSCPVSTNLIGPRHY